MRFSDRIGATVPRSILQVDSIDLDLRNCLWQACIEHYIFPRVSLFNKDCYFKYIISMIYVDFFKKAADQTPYGHDANINQLRYWFFEAEWWDVYNFVEFLLNALPDEGFAKRLNFFLEREKSGYRVVGDAVLKITDPIEIEAINISADLSDRFSASAQHIRAAVSLFSKKPEPDYRNAIKEAISAVELIVRVITNSPKATLGDALKRLDQQMPNHPALREAMNKLYGYTSDEAGIRHALLEDSKVDETEAKFMIVTCSAFVNFCVQRSI